MKTWVLAIWTIVVAGLGIATKLLGRLGFRRKPPRKLQPDIFGVRHGRLRFRPLMVVLGLGLSILFFWRASSYFLTSSRTPTLAELILGLSFVFLGLYMVWASIMSFTYKVEYSSISITVTGYLFRPKCHDWATLVDIDSGWIPETSRLVFAGSGSALILDFVEGRDEIMNFAQGIIKNA